MSNSSLDATSLTIWLRLQNNKVCCGGAAAPWRRKLFFHVSKSIFWRKRKPPPSLQSSTGQSTGLPSIMRRSLVLLPLLLAQYAVTCDALSIIGSLGTKTSQQQFSSRRDVFAAAGVTAAGVWLPRKAAAAAAAGGSIGSDTRPIAVVGASGRTGSLCVASCLRRGIKVRALTRSGSWSPPATDATDESTLTVDNDILSIQQCDARDPAALEAGVAGCRGVIYAASASKKGGNAKAIDNEAVVATGNACIAKGVGRYVVISSTATTRPKSLGYLFTNVYQNIMAEKRLGELGVTSSYNNKSISQTYSIIRPGGLEEPKLNAVLGPKSLELSQGDVLAGIISRADLAEVAVEAALSQSPALQNTSFELYYTDSTQPCEGRFKSLLQNGEVARLHGGSYAELFAQLKHDGEYNVPV